MTEGVRIDELPPTPSPSLEHVLAAMKNGDTVLLTVGQIADLVLTIIRNGAPEALDTLAELATFASAISGTVDGHTAAIAARVLISAYDIKMTALDAADAARVLTTTYTAGLATKQPIDAMLTALAALTSTNGKFLAFTGADTPVLRDIKGTVSQSSGVPTGAIVEQGSNANGEYVRFADGTQICRITRSSIVGNLGAAGGVYRDLLAWPSWTYPAAFSSAPSLAFSVASSVYWIGGGASVGATAVTDITIFCYGVVNSTVPTHAIAVGRWY